MTLFKPYKIRFLVTASISTSIQEQQELHALSPPLAGQYTGISIIGRVKRASESTKIFLLLYVLVHPCSAHAHEGGVAKLTKNALHFPRVCQ